MTEFEKCTVTKKDGDRFTIRCRLNFWSVSAKTLEQALNEARHYFYQYRKDGEYYKILGGKSPSQLIWESLK